MSVFYWLVEAGATLAECAGCYYFLSCLNAAEQKESWKDRCILSVVLCICILIFNSMVLASAFTVVFAVCFVSVSLKVAYRIAMTESLPLVGFYYSCMNAIDCLIMVVLGIIIGNDQIVLHLISGFSFGRCIYIVISKILLIVCITLLKNVLEHLYFTLKFFLIVDTLGLIGGVYLIDLTIHSANPATALNWAFFLAFMILLVFLIGLYGKYRAERERKRIIQINYQAAWEQYENLIENGKRIRKIQHDFRNHMHVLLNLLQEEKFENAIDYLKEIGISIDHNDNYIWTGNHVIDFILNHKRKSAMTAGIDFSIDADIIYADKINNEDLCVIFANLLDNALEAASQGEQAQRWIQVTIRKAESLLIIKIKNSLSVQPIKNGRYLLTTKKDKWLHGLGLESVQEVISKYGGEFHYSYDETSFLANITFFDC